MSADPVEAQQQFVAIDEIPAVGLPQIREIELGGQQARLLALHLDVKMRRPPCVVAGPDGLEPERAGGVGKLMAAIAETAVVVPAALVAMPQVDNRAGTGRQSGVSTRP